MDEIRVFRERDGEFAYADMAEDPEYGRIMLFATSYLPPSINRSYRSYAVSYKPKNDPTARKWRGVFSASQSLRNWKAWGEEVSEDISAKTEGLWFEDGLALSSVKVTVTMGRNSDIDARTKAVQDVFQGCVFGNDSAISLSGDIKIATHKKFDQGVLYLLCEEQAYFRMLERVYGAVKDCGIDFSAKKRRTLSMRGETVYKLYCGVREALGR